MVFDARGKKHPEPLEMIRNHFRQNCRQKIDISILVDSSECAKTASAFAQMSKCKTEIEKAEGHFIIKVKGDMCSCN